MCNCIETVNKDIAEKFNSALRSTIPLTATGVARIILATEKADPRKHGKAVTLVASFCPICGEKYQAAQHQLQPTGDGVEKSESDPKNSSPAAE